MNAIEYSACYDSVLLRGQGDAYTPRPWDLHAAIKSHSGQNKVLLDIGCGTAFKVLPLAPSFKKMIGVDPSQSMLEVAQKNASERGIENLILLQSVGEHLPLSRNSVDMVTCMVSRWDVSEIHRVLKPDGVVLIEHIGCEDKKEFKMFFGKDQRGWRGQLIDYSVDEYLEMRHRLFSRFFNRVFIKNAFWNTYYTVEGLRQLLQYTPTIRDYHSQNDELAFHAAIEHFSTPQGIKLVQNRILIYAEDPKVL